MVYGFIGTGNMGGALATSVSKSTKDVLLADHFAEKAAELASKLGVKAADNETIAAKCDYIFLGVKPQMMAEMLSGISETLKSRTDKVVLVTMAAGLKIETIREMAGSDFKIIRIMPNTPALVEAGEILYCNSANTTEQEINTFLVQYIPPEAPVQMKVAVFYYGENKSALCVVENHMCMDGGDL